MALILEVVHLLSHSPLCLTLVAHLLHGALTLDLMCRKAPKDEGSDTADSGGDRKVEVLASTAEACPAASPQQGLEPEDVATCDPKYWACPGANGLKVDACSHIPHDLTAHQPRATDTAVLSLANCTCVLGQGAQLCQARQDEMPLYEDLVFPFYLPPVRRLST